MQRARLGSRVRTVDQAALIAALRLPAALRPEPGQMLWASRTAKVVGYRKGPKGRPSYVLSGVPGLWPEEWLDPLPTIGTISPAVRGTPRV